MMIPPAPLNDHDLPSLPHNRLYVIILPPVRPALVSFEVVVDELAGWGLGAVLDAEGVGGGVC